MKEKKASPQPSPNGEGVSFLRIKNGNKVKTTFWNRKNNIRLSSPSPFGELCEVFSRPKGVAFRVRLAFKNYHPSPSLTSTSSVIRRENRVAAIENWHSVIAPF